MPTQAEPAGSRPSRCYITGKRHPAAPVSPEPPTESGQPVEEPRISDDFGSVLHSAGFLSGSENRWRIILLSLLLLFLSACLPKSLGRKSHVTCVYVSMKKSFSPVLSKTERPAPPPIGLCSAGTRGPFGSEEGGTGVLSKPFLSRGTVRTESVWMTPSAADG